MRLKKPRPASSEEVRTTRERGTARIEYADPSIRGGTVARSSGTCVVFAWSSAGILQPPMMRTSTPQAGHRKKRC